MKWGKYNSKISFVWIWLTLMVLNLVIAYIAGNHQLGYKPGPPRQADWSPFAAGAAIFATFALFTILINLLNKWEDKKDKKQKVVTKSGPGILSSLQKKTADWIHGIPSYPPRKTPRS